jgi:small subunit ribosomal protein S17
MADEEQNENVEETTPAPEAAAAEDTAAPSAPKGEPVPQLAPKERRQQARAVKAAKAGTRSAQTVEERQAERAVKRAKNAARRRNLRAKAREAAKATPNGEPTPPREHGEGRQKLRQGIVVSDKADKTITVRIDTARRHRRYEKIVRSSTTFHAHDESNDANTGDTVIIRESRPLSRLKRWRLVEVVERAK